MIETLSINAVRNSIVTSEYLSQFIADNDKEPSWDGFVYIYNNKKKTKNSMIGRLPVQVKGKLSNNINHKSINYSVSTSDLRNYLNDKGVFFFVVYLLKNSNYHSSSNEKIYYAALSPIELRRYLKKAKNKQTQTITLYEFPQNSLEKSNIFLNAYKHFHKQTSFSNTDLLSIKELTELGILEGLTIPFSYFGSKANFTSEFLKRDEVYLYAKIKNTSIEQPIDIEMKNFMLGENHSIDISVNGKLFYNGFSIIRTKSEEYLKIGESVQFPLKDDQFLGSVDYKQPKNLRTRAKDLDFFLSFIESGQMAFGEKIMYLNKEDELFRNIDLVEFKNELHDLKTIIELLDLLNINDDIDLSTLSADDWRWINVLITSLIEKQNIQDLNLDLPVFTYINISKFKILIFVDKPDNENYKIVNIFGEKVHVTNRTEEGKDYPVSQYSLLKSSHFVEAVNIQFEVLLSDFKKIGKNEHNIHKANDILLELLKAYDVTKNRKDIILKTATEFALWIISIDKNSKYLPKEIKSLNYLQLIRRERTFTPDEIHSLYVIAKKKNISDEILIGVYLLLEDQNKVSYYFNKLTPEEQERIVDSPIYYFRKP